MNNSPEPGNVTDELSALYELQILDTAPEKEFDDIAALAALISGSPIAIVGFSDTERFWFKAKYGGSKTFTEIPGGLALCKYSEQFAKNGIVVMEDIAEDECFSTNPVLIKENIRFNANVPLVNENGITLGYLCVLDTQPRQLDQRQIDGLKMLAEQVVALLKLRLQLFKNEEAEYSNNENQMRNIFLNAIDAIIVTDKKEKILQWNTKAEEVFGWKESDVLGKFFYEICIPPRFQEYHINGPKNTPYFNVFLPRNTIETIAIRKNKKEFDITLGISSAKIKDRTYYIYFIRDITNIKLASKELDRQKEFYENILNNIPTDIAVFDPNHKYTFVNPYAIRNPDYRKFIIGRDDFEYSEFRKRDLSLAKVRREKFMEAKEQGKEIRWEDSVVGPDGKTMTSLRRMFPVQNEKGELTMIIGFGIDITDRKEMEEKQSALLKQLSIQNTQLADFCNIVSHNLRAPLVNMSLLVEFIEACGDTEEQKQLIAKLNPVLDNLNTTFNELVESIQVKQDLEIQSEKILFADCMSRTIESLETEISKLGAVFEFDFDEAPAVYYPAKYLYSIFHNLISNALKYHSPNRKPIIQLKTKKTDQKITLSVSDNGLGIDIARHKANFFKIGKVFHHHPNAKGFGLYMIKTHIEAMGGKIWVVSAPDEGATFYVDFINQHL